MYIFVCFLTEVKEDLERLMANISRTANVVRSSIKGTVSYQSNVSSLTVLSIQYMELILWTGDTKICWCCCVQLAN